MTLLLFVYVVFGPIVHILIKLIHNLYAVCLNLLLYRCLS